MLRAMPLLVVQLLLLVLVVQCEGKAATLILIASSRRRFQHTS